MNLLSTIASSDLKTFFPTGWNLKKIDECCSNAPDQIFDSQPFWHRDFMPILCEDNTTFGMMMGHEIAHTVKQAKDAGEKLAMILPVGPMSMYQWAVYFLKEWNIDCKHVYGFNMDEWSDEAGNTLDKSSSGSFQRAMEIAFYNPLGALTVPESQRNFATKESLPAYEDKISDLKSRGAKLVTVFGIGRVFHIAFWEPHFAGEYDRLDEWKAQTHRLGARLHPLTIEQNALHSFKSRTTLVPAFANTIGPGLFLQSDKVIGGCDGCYERGMMWQGMSLWVALRYGPDKWVPASWMPTMPGRLFFIRQLAGPLEAECK